MLSKEFARTLHDELIELSNRQNQNIIARLLQNEFSNSKK